MSHPITAPPIPVDYYRKHAARIRELAREATTPAVKQHLVETALEYEQLAENVQIAERRSGTLD